jgi:Xaa-Pro dipeptidase
MRDQASPITVDERRGRIEKARRLMGQNSLGALMLTGGTTLAYFTGIRWGLSERLFAIVVPLNGQPFVVSPAFEEERAREQLATGPLGSTEVLTWEEHESPYDLVASGLRTRGLATGNLGLEETVRFRCGSCSATG